MPTKKAQFLPASEGDITDVFETLTDVEGDEELTDAQKKTDELTDALTDDEGAYILVSRQLNGGNATMEHVGRFPADKFDLGQLKEHLRSHFGGGDYRIMLYGFKPGGKRRVLRANKLLSIATPKIDSDASPQNSNSDMSIILNAIREQNQQFMVMLKNNDAGQSRKEMYEEMLIMKQLFSNDSPAQNTNPISDIRNTLALVDEIKGGINEPKEDKTFMDVIEQVTPTFNKFLDAKANQNNASQGNPKMFENIQLKIGLGKLVKAAKKNSDPGLYADFILDQFESQTVQKFLLSKESFENLIKLNPEIQSCETWFNDLGEHLKAQLGLESKFADQYDDEPKEDLQSSTGDVISGESETINNDVT